MQFELETSAVFSPNPAWVFQQTGKDHKTTMAAPAKCFLVTGSPGVGKTTLIAKIVETLKSSNPNLKIQGFFTREMRQEGERVGFEVVTLDGRTAPLASINTSSAESNRWPMVGKYKVDVASFESLALPELQVKEDTDLFVIDEVGKMELFSSLFFPAVLRVLESNKPFLATIPVPKAGRNIPAVARLKNHPGATVFSLTKSNRDAMKDQICSQLAGQLIRGVVLPYRNITQSGVHHLKTGHLRSALL
ncbi:putative nucleoside-triphosphate phosphatase [Helianthus annuus]|uniref:Nucleoside-triphosphate phosphatase n=1 Tax=Helianthus annuus TaxID=4232 RepID=A0A9K3E9Q0_HELAN|nr:putative nucleoside-triphosphate phosphatase [Helianthus annuus]KAJ0840371.1 putative nucleoside-triphosphate phosphatase [Helianthus annuus]